MTNKAIYLTGPANCDSDQHHLVPDAVVRGRFLFSGGIAGFDDKGDLLFSSVLTGAGSLEDQTRQAFASARKVVETGGFKWADVGHMYVWYESHAARSTVDRVWAEVFPNKDDRPARHCVVTKLPAGTQVGVELTAAR